MFDFVVSVEEEFIKEKIEQRYIDHCADGDLWIGKYASLRNEAYTLVKDEYEYPLMIVGGMQWSKQNLLHGLKYIGWDISAIVYEIKKHIIIHYLFLC